MTIARAIVSGLATKDLRSSKGTSRQAIKSWLVKNKHCKDVASTNAAIRHALKKAMAEGFIVAVGSHRFSLNVARYAADRKAATAKAAAKRTAIAAKAKAAAKKKSIAAKAKANAKSKATKKKNASKRRASKKKAPKKRSGSKSKVLKKSKSKSSKKKTTKKAKK